MPNLFSFSQSRNAHTSSKNSFVRENPLLTSTRILLFVCVGACLVAIWGLWGLPFRSIPDKLFYGIWLILEMWCLYRALVTIRLLKHIEQFRMKLAEKTSFEPSGVFPFQQTAQPLIPPILLRPAWGFMMVCLVYGLLLGQMFVQPLLTPLLIQVLLFKLSFVLLVTGLVFFFGLRVRYKVEATQSGLTSVYGIRTKVISWQQTQLFVCYQVPGLFFGGKTTMIYELSGPNQVVQWTCVLGVRSPFASWRPVLPIGEYQREVQELCQFITIKTGLQLHNLSEVEQVDDPQAKALQRFGL